VWDKIDDIPAHELWAVRTHLKRKLVFYMRERVRQRWIKGGFPRCRWWLRAHCSTHMC
jgi:hypothetical protein